MFFAVGDRPVLVKCRGKLINVAITPAMLAEARSAGRRTRSPEDQQASPSMRRHLGEGAAGALRCRRCSIVPNSPPEGARDDARADLARRQRRARRCACAAAAQSRGFPARASPADRHACRLRARRLRRLHGARQRRDRALLPDAGGAGRQGARSRPSKDCPTAARSPICRPRFATAMRCNAASARRAC